MGHSITPIEDRQTSLAVLADEINEFHAEAEEATSRALQPATTIIDADNGCKTPEKPEPIISIIGADNANNVACPNCGRAVQPDDDGDCPACLHPHIDQVEQAVGQSVLPPAPEPTACTPADLAIFTPQMVDGLADIHRALLNVAISAGFQTRDWPAFPDDHPIAVSLQAVWCAIKAFAGVIEESGIFADEEGDQ